jgi:Cellulase (glycosyl hydrolase family 5)
MNRRLPVVLTLCLAALAALPTYASARSNQISIIQDDAKVIASGDATRNATLDEMRGLGADVIKISISWRDLANGGKPATPEDPNAYPAGKWAPYDAAVQGAIARGLGVFLNVGGPAPDWAVSRPSTPAGTYRPNAAQFGRFVKAVGTRYSGVRLWSVWNEPNLPVFLLPQRSSTKSHYPVSPTLYRNLYRAAYNGLSTSGHAKDTILLGELLPVGKSSHTPRSSIRPLDFLRELACVDRHYHAYKGANAKARGCKGYKALPLSGIAYHPYSLAGGPTKRPPSRDDATIGTLSRVTKVVDRLRARHRFAGRAHPPLWLTEFGVQTDPPDYLFGAPIKRVPTYLGMSERIAMRNRRVYSYSQYPLFDDRTTSGFQSGLRFYKGNTKPGIYQEYKLPIFVRRSGRSAVDFWGGVRSADKGGTVMLYSRVGSKGKFTVLKKSVKLRARGYFEIRVRASNASKRQFKFGFGKQRSITVTAH